MLFLHPWAQKDQAWPASSSPPCPLCPTQWHPLNVYINLSHPNFSQMRLSNLSFMYPIVQLALGLLWESRQSNFFLLLHQLAIRHVWKEGYHDERRKPLPEIRPQGRSSGPAWLLIINREHFGMIFGDFSYSYAVLASTLIRRLRKKRLLIA